jgi:DNA-binding transcriptional LysR family regulator
MDIKILNAFVVLAEEMHFTRAAERLGVAQPVMSQWIRKLEAELGATLVERTTRSLHLTPAGMAALPHARKTVQAARLVERAAQSDGSAPVGAVTLGYAGASSRPWLPRVARAVRAEAPGVELRLRSMVYAGSAPSLVASGDLDIAFSRRPLTHPGLAEHVFEYERVLLALPSDHHLASREELALEEVRDDPWVMFPATRGSSVREMGLRLAEQAGFTPRIAQEAPDSYTILGLVAAGVGVTLTISSVAHIDTPGLRLVPLAGPPRWLAATVVSPRRPTRAVQAVLDIIQRELPTPPRPDGLVLE